LETRRRGTENAKKEKSRNTRIPPFFTNRQLPEPKVRHHELGLESTGTEKAVEKKEEKREEIEKKKKRHPEGELVDLIQTTSGRCSGSKKEKRKVEGGHSVEVARREK
jgi:hypothetical protein